MNIIEREIKKREDLIVTRSDKLAEAEQLEAQAADIRGEYEPLDVGVLQAEIDELRTYIAQSDESPEQPDSVAVDGTGVPV